MCRSRVIVLVALTVGGGFAAGEPPPVSAYSHPPEIDHVRLSPDGDRILMLRPVDGVRQLFVTDVETGQTVLAVEIDAEDHILRGCEWATNDRAVCRAFVFPPTSNPFVERPGGGVFHHMYLARLFTVDHDGGQGINLVPKRRGGPHLVDEWEHQVVGYLHDDPDHILVAVPRRHIYDKEVYRQNIHRNRWTAVVGTLEGITKWTADQSGERLIGVGAYWLSRPEEGPTVAVVDPGGEVRRVDTKRLSGPERAWMPRVVGFSNDGSSAYVEARVDGADRAGLWEMDASTLLPRRLIADDPRYDILTTAVEGRDCGIVGFAHHRTEKVFTWLDPAFGEMIRRLDEAIPGEIRSVPSINADCGRVVVATLGGGRSKTYYLHDRNEGWTRRLGSQYPALDGAWVMEQERTGYRAVDGTELAATLTLPLRRGSERLPLVVLTRGGAPPHDALRFDPWPHFLAGRGYAVLEPEFRGTPGRGIDFQTAGFRDWSATMQGDVWDGVDWLVADGLVDGDRVCFMGRGRGARWGLTGAFANTRTRCAVVFVAEEAAFRDSWDLQGSHDLYAARLSSWWTGTWEKFGRFWDLDGYLSTATGWSRQGWRQTVRSPLTGAEHPGFPILVSRDADRHRVHERQTGQFRSQLKSIVENETRMAPLGGAHEAAFLEQAEKLLAQELSPPERTAAAPARLEPVAD